MKLRQFISTLILGIVGELFGKRTKMRHEGFLTYEEYMRQYEEVPSRLFDGINREVLFRNIQWAKIHLLNTKNWDWEIGRIHFKSA